MHETISYRYTHYIAAWVYEQNCVCLKSRPGTFFVRYMLICCGLMINLCTPNCRPEVEVCVSVSMDLKFY